MKTIKTIRLTENDVARMVKQSLKKFLTEINEPEFDDKPNYIELVNDYVKQNINEIPDSEAFDWEDVAMCAFDIINDSIYENEFEVTLGDGFTIWGEGSTMRLETPDGDIYQDKWANDVVQLIQNGNSHPDLADYLVETVCNSIFSLLQQAFSDEDYDEI